MTVGGVDTYYDYEDKQWKSRRLGGGPLRREPVCPTPKKASAEEAEPDPQDAHQQRPSRPRPTARRTSV
ncbi:hypothetical protein [Kribbella sp. NPDC006257]|uniref:hypothetical protein n=1 Tax=Kribbella sp. NPDC006257 TaxID=3156738 RepID=UPI0033A14967